MPNGDTKMKTSISKSLFLVALLTSCNETPVKYIQCFKREKACNLGLEYSCDEWKRLQKSTGH